MKIANTFISASLVCLLAFVPFSAALSQSGNSATTGTFYGAKATEYPPWFKESFLDVREDALEAAEQGKHLIYFFHQDGCPYCNALVERNLSQKDIVEKIRTHFDVVELNIWGDREVVSESGHTVTEKQFSAALPVQFTPTLIFFDEKADKVLRLNGYVPPQQFRLALDYVASGHESSMTYREFVERNQPESSGSRRMNSQPFFKQPPYDLSVRTGRPAAVFFEQGDCPNCETLHTVVLSDPDTQAAIADFDVIQLDMWSKTQIVTPQGKEMTARQWATQLDIAYAPTLVLFDRDRSEVIRSEAWFKVFHTHSLFAYVSDESFRNEPNFQRYLSARADHFIEQGIDVDIWK